MKPGRKPGTPKTGGRVKGTLNRTTDDTRRLIEKALGGSPLEKMATLARELLDGKRVLMVPIFERDDDGVAQRSAVESDAKAIEVATKLLSEIAQYHSPKRKAIEHTGPGGGPMQMTGLSIEVVESRGAH